MPALLLLAAAAAATPGLAVFDPLLGQCFAGEVAEGAIDTHCYEPAYGGTHVLDRHRVVAGGQMVYAGETLYSREGAELSFTYWNSNGGMGRGAALPFDNGICFEGTMRGNPDAPPQSTASCLRWEDSGYSMVNGDGSPVRFAPGAEPFR